MKTLLACSGDTEARPAPGGYSRSPRDYGEQAARKDPQSLHTTGRAPRVRTQCRIMATKLQWLSDNPEARASRRGGGTATNSHAPHFARRQSLKAHYIGPCEPMGQGHPDGIPIAVSPGHREGSQLPGQGAPVSPSQCQDPLSNLPVSPKRHPHPQCSAQGALIHWAQVFPLSGERAPMSAGFITPSP